MLSPALTLRRAKSTPGRRPFGVGGYDGVQALRGGGEVAVLLDVAEQIHAEVVEAEVGDGDAGVDVFEFDDLVLEPAELLLAECGVAGFGVRTLSSAVPARSAMTMRFSTRSLRLMYSSSEMSGQKFTSWMHGVCGADAVDAAEPLDDPDRVPVDVVVDEVVAVLKVLALGDAVGADEHIDLAGSFGENGGFFFGPRREEGEQRLEIVAASRVWILGLSVPVTLPVWKVLLLQ